MLLICQTKVQALADQSDKSLQCDCIIDDAFGDCATTIYDTWKYADASMTSSPRRILLCCFTCPGGAPRRAFILELTSLGSVAFQRFSLCKILPPACAVGKSSTSATVTCGGLLAAHTISSATLIAFKG